MPNGTVLWMIIDNNLPTQLDQISVSFDGGRATRQFRRGRSWIYLHFQYLSLFGRGEISRNSSTSYSNFIRLLAQPSDNQRIMSLIPQEDSNSISKPPRRKVKSRYLILLGISLLAFFVVPLIPMSVYCYSAWVSPYQYLLFAFHGESPSIDWSLPFLSFGECWYHLPHGLIRSWVVVEDLDLDRWIMEETSRAKIEIIKRELRKENRSETFFLNFYPSYFENLEEIRKCLTQLKAKGEINNDGAWWKLVLHNQRGTAKK